MDIEIMELWIRKWHMLNIKYRKINISSFLSHPFCQYQLSHPTKLTFFFFFFMVYLFYFIFSFIFISWRLITSQHCSGFCHTLTWISHGVTCIPHPDAPSHLPLLPIPLGLPSASGPSTCLMHPTWAGDLFHYR